MRLLSEDEELDSDKLYYLEANAVSPNRISYLYRNCLATPVIGHGVKAASSYAYYRKCLANPVIRLGMKTASSYIL